MATRPQVSVIVPFLDAAPFLLQAARSVMRQTFKDWELVLVDGGSQDASREIALALARRHPGQVRVLRHAGEKPLGIFPSRALGARHARAPLIALLDSDDELHPRLLETHLACYRRALGKKPGLVFCPSIHWWDGRSPARRMALQPAPPSGLHRPPSLLPHFLEGGYIKTPTTSGSLMARRLLLESASLRGGQHMVEDQYLWSFIALRYPIVVSARPLVWYRQRPDSTCARGLAAGRFAALRRRHLRWLLRQVRARRPSPRRRDLAAMVGLALARNP